MSPHLEQMLNHLRQHPHAKDVYLMAADLASDEGDDMLERRLRYQAANRPARTQTVPPQSVHGIAAHMDRLFPDQVDDTPREWGYGYESGHVGHEHEGEFHVVGHFAGAGNVGEPVLYIHHEDLPIASHVVRRTRRGDARYYSDVIDRLRDAGVRME